MFAARRRNSKENQWLCQEVLPHFHKLRESCFARNLSPALELDCFHCVRNAVELSTQDHTNLGFSCLAKFVIRFCAMLRFCVWRNSVTFTTSSKVPNHNWAVNAELTDGHDGFHLHFCGELKMLAKLHTVQSMMTLVFMNQTAMDDPNVIVLMNVSENTTLNRDRVTPQKLDNF